MGTGLSSRALAWAQQHQQRTEGEVEADLLWVKRAAAALARLGQLSVAAKKALTARLRLHLIQTNSPMSAYERCRGKTRSRCILTRAIL